jgi:hypothetical protein
MASWTLLHVQSPLNAAGGPGRIGELTRASSRSMNFSTEDGTSLSFTMPGGHPQTAQIIPLRSDVLVFRDDVPAQRFRIVSRALTSNAGILSATFSGVSYKTLFDAWVFHDSDTRSWPTATEQANIAWSIISAGQAKPFGNLGITQGVKPKAPVLRTRIGEKDDKNVVHPFYEAGKSRGEAVRDMAELTDGFEWDIEPSPTDPYNGLVFNAWSKSTGGRNQFAPARSSLILSDGGTIVNWSHTITPTEYGNVVRVSGSGDGSGADIEAPNPDFPVWQPGNQDPAENTDLGRWERNVSVDVPTQGDVVLQAPAALDRANLYLAEVTVDLRRGRWQGPRQLWIGDTTRLVISPPVDGPLTNPPSYVIYIDEDVRVVEIGVNVDDLGAEDVTLSLNRPRFSPATNRRNINDRLTRLERR